MQFLKAKQLLNRYMRGKGKQKWTAPNVCLSGGEFTLQVRHVLPTRGLHARALVNDFILQGLSAVCAAFIIRVPAEAERKRKALGGRGIKSAKILRLGCGGAKGAQRPQPEHPDGKKSLVQDIDDFGDRLGGLFFFEMTGLIEENFFISGKDSIRADIAGFVQAA